MLLIPVVTIISAIFVICRTTQVRVSAKYAVISEAMIIFETLLRSRDRRYINTAIAKRHRVNLSVIIQTEGSMIHIFM